MCLVPASQYNIECLSILHKHPVHLVMLILIHTRNHAHTNAQLFTYLVALLGSRCHKRTRTQERINLSHDIPKLLISINPDMSVSLSLV